jgi:hypothetical protein
MSTREKWMAGSWAVCAALVISSCSFDKDDLFGNASSEETPDGSATATADPVSESASLPSGALSAVSLKDTSLSRDRCYSAEVRVESGGGTSCEDPLRAVESVSGPSFDRLTVVVSKLSNGYFPEIEEVTYEEVSLTDAVWSGRRVRFLCAEDTLYRSDKMKSYECKGADSLQAWKPGVPSSLEEKKYVVNSLVLTNPGCSLRVQYGVHLTQIGCPGAMADHDRGISAGNGYFPVASSWH